MAQHLDSNRTNANTNISHETQIYQSGFSDHFLLFFIAAIGFLGSIYTFSYCEPADDAAQISAITNSPSLNTFLIPNKEYNFENDVRVTGSKEVGQQLIFSLVNHTPGSRFLLDFGNGKQKIIDQESIDHVYSNSGSFKVQLKAIKSNKLHTVCSQTIHIRENQKLTLK